MSDLGHRVVDQARSWLETPFHHAGRNRFGLDCAGLIAVVAHALGITEFDDVNYPPEPDPAYLTAVLQRFAAPVLYARREPGIYALMLEPGDLLQFTLAGAPRHVGIYATNERGQGTLIHCYQSVGKVVEHLFDKHWAQRLFAAYRFREPA